MATLGRTRGGRRRELGFRPAEGTAGVNGGLAWSSNVEDDE